MALESFGLAQGMMQIVICGWALADRSKLDSQSDVSTQAAQTPVESFLASLLTFKITGRPSIDRGLRLSSREPKLTVMWCGRRWPWLVEKRKAERSPKSCSA